MATASQFVNASWGRALSPPPLLTVSEWADRSRIVAAPSPEPGPWKTSRTPYLREIMDALSPSSAARYITFEKGTQIGGTEAGLNWTGYTIDQDPTSMIIMLPTQSVTDEWSRVRLAQLVEHTPALRGKILDVTRRDAGNTLYSKRISDGLGFLKLTWSSSAAKLRSTPAANLLMDEVDGFEEDTGGEGDPITLLEKRFANFPRGKSFRLSTPTRSPGSRIHREFLKGDQRFYFLPCPHCGHHQRLVMPSLRWGSRPKAAETPEERDARFQGAMYRCSACRELIEERLKTEMLERGVWVATAEDPELRDHGFGSLEEVAEILARMKLAKHASFHLSSLYSPLGWYSWAKIAEDFEATKDDPRLLKVFVMTTLGEVWIDRGEAPDAKRLFERREDYERGIVPKGAFFLTGGVDVQKDRLEFEIVAWGPRKESWSLQAGALEGDTSGEAVWKRLGELLALDWPTAEEGSVPIQVLAIDTGFRPQPVYEFARARAQAVFSPAGWRVIAPRTVLPVKGGSGWERLISRYSSSDAARSRGGVKIVEVGTAYAKQELYDWLRHPAPTAPGETHPPGFCHFPAYPYAFFQGLTSESRITTSRGKLEWVKEPSLRNEPLDCRVYARAAAGIFGLDDFKDQHWKRLGWNAAKLAVVPPQKRTGEAARQEADDDWLGGRGGDWF